MITRSLLYIKTDSLKVLNSLVTKEDVHAIVNILRISPNLTNVQIRRGANDDLLDVLGEHCQSLREISMACSTGVTDEGIRRLLLGDSGDRPRACHNTLTQVKLRGTRVRRDGLRLLLKFCLSLQGVRCNIMDVLHALSAFIKVSSMLYLYKKITFNCRRIIKDMTARP